jgi:branched-chain amino acid transport system substrate-binding protein
MNVKQFVTGTRVLTLSAAALIALVVAACGSSNNSNSGGQPGSSGGGSTSAGGSPSAGKSPYVIGSIVSETGPFASSDAAGAEGIKAWASYVNSHGGINGHPIQLSVKDDQGNPATALSIVKSFAADSKVLALVGSVSSEEGAWGPVASAEKLPVVGDFPFTPVSYSSKYVYPQGTTFPSTLYGQVYAAIKLAHAQKIGLYYCAEESACAGSVGPVKSAATSLGGALVNAQAVPATAPNYDAVCQAAKSAGVQTMVMALGEGTIVSLANSCASVGYTPNYVYQTTALTPAQGSVSSLNNHSYGVTETFPWVSSGTVAQQAFQSGVKAANVPANDYGAALSLAWTGGALFQNAMTSSIDASTRASVATAVESLPKGTTLGGLAPPLTYAAGGATPQVKCFFVMKLADGKWTSPYGATKTFCQP